MKHLVIPDCQVKPDVDTEHLEHIGRYIVDKRPDVIVCIGDFADMPSLSSYDVGKKSFEGRRYKNDIEAVHEAMDRLLSPIRDLNRELARGHLRSYRPRKILTLGNHENRITRCVNSDPKLDETISLDDLGYREFGWEVYPFLDVVVVDGVAYSHYFTTGVMGRPVTTASALLTKKHMSCVMGHHQHDGVSSQYRADGKRITGIFAGSCYTHEEDYLYQQGNQHWRGIWMLNEVDEGTFDHMQVSLNFLRKKYG